MTPTGRFLVPVTLLVPLLFRMAGCASHRLVVDQPNPATGYENATLTAYFWGIVEREEVAGNCLDHALDEVRVRTNPAYALVTVICLGIVVPVEVPQAAAVRRALEA
ncbi:MAG: hypothetical protein AAGA68_15680 [Pseudomonadota bacterium]